MSQESSSKAHKVERALELVTKSGGMKSLPLKFDHEQWAGIFSQMDEEKIDDLLLILEEEKEMELISDQTAKKAHKVNETRYLQRLEKLKISLEQESQTPPDHA